MKFIKNFEKMEKFERHMDAAEQLSVKFFEESGNFGSEEMITVNSTNIEMKFYFMTLESNDLDQVMLCKNYIPKYLEFFVSNTKVGLILNIVLTQDFLKLLEDKLKLDKDSNKYNL